MSDSDSGEDPVVAAGLRKLAAAADGPVEVRGIAGRARSRGRPFAPVVIVAVVVGAAAVLSVPAGPGTEARPQTIAESAAQVREVFQFESLAEMVATSTIVVEAEVESIRPGRVVPDGSPQGLQFDEVTLRVSRVFIGSQVETVVVEEDGALAAKSNPNDAGIYFLMEKRDRPGVYRLASSAGRYRLDASGRLHGSNPESDLAVALEKLSLAELRAAVSDAVVIVQRGDVTPVPYPTAQP